MGVGDGRGGRKMKKTTQEEEKDMGELGVVKSVA